MCRRAMLLNPRMKLGWFEINDYTESELSRFKKELVDEIVISALSKGNTSAEIFTAAPETNDNVMMEEWERKLHAKHPRIMCRRDYFEDEVNSYFREPVQMRTAETYDPLQWWQVNHHRYPNLANLARYYLATPAAATSAERVFSKGRDLIGVRRCSLEPRTSRILMLMRSWFNDLPENIMNKIQLRYLTEVRNSVRRGKE
jgi:hypothetical protein